MPDLGLTVEPGYQFNPALPDGGEAVDLDKLNQLGAPVVKISAGALTESLLDADLAQRFAGLNNYNYIMNGDFAITPDEPVNFVTSYGGGAMSAEEKKYIMMTLDRWGVTKNNVAGTTITRGAIQNGSEYLPVSDYFLRWTQANVLGVNPSFLAQRIENVGTLAGQKATLSFRAASSADFAIGVQLAQHFGIGGAPSADVDTPVQSIDLEGGVWKLHTATFDLPSIFGQVLGTNMDGGDWLELRIIGPAGRSFTLNIGEVKLEEGPVATPFKRVIPAESLVRCQRYLEFSRVLISNDITVWRPSLEFKVTKRFKPNVTITDLAAGTGGAMLAYSYPEMTYQTANNSIIALATVRIAAELSRTTGAPGADT